jgi:Domain of unknown function (DUF4397)
MTSVVTRVLGFGAIALALTAFGSAASAQDAPNDQVGSVRVVHGLRGLVADIYLDGNLALPTFQPERATDPLSIPAGDHVIEIRTAGAAATDAPLLTQTVTVPAGFEGSLIAHLGADGQPTLTAYADDLSAVPAGQTRVVVRHAAAADGVNVLLNDQPAIASLAPEAEGTDIVPAGNYTVAVTETTGGAPLAAPQDVQFAEGTATFMYLIGSQADGTLGWAAVQVKDLQTAPAVIQTGDGSTLSTDSGPNPLAVGAIAATLVAAIGTTFVARSRRTSH